MTRELIFKSADMSSDLIPDYKPTLLPFISPLIAKEINDEMFVSAFEETYLYNLVHKFTDVSQ